MTCKLGVVACEISGRHSSPSISRIIQSLHWKGEWNREMVPHSTQSKKWAEPTFACRLVSLLLMVMPLSINGPKAHHWPQPNEGKKGCMFGLLYSDGFMLLLHDKLHGGRRVA